MAPEEVKANGWLIFETIAGSRAYGLASENSDTDIRGVFILPLDYLLGMEYIPQISNETNDIVYFELKRFLELLSKNNPNMLELLAVPDDCIIYRHDIMDMIKPEQFLSKLCESSFANYAFTQIKKAYGLEKKIINPVDKEKKTVLDFCFVYVDKLAVLLKDYLNSNNFKQEEMGLTSIHHFRDMYRLFRSEAGEYSGVIRKETANDVCLSSIPEGRNSIAILYFNRDGYSVYCRKYKEYWDWVEKRNEGRYAGTMKHGKNYDAKNMMHVFRLLLVAKEIATEGKLNVRRSDREFLLDIKAGKYEYDELLSMAHALHAQLPNNYLSANLPESPDLLATNQLLVAIRRAYYSTATGVQSFIFLNNNDL
jgi:predicted nucleotidyltransferase